MDAKHILQLFEHSGGILTPEADADLSHPARRRELYKLLVVLPSLALFSALLRELLCREVAFRKALWDMTVEDEGDFYESIYQCAFLLYRLGKVEDIASLWAAKHINMDVGSSMGAEFFVGAGINESLEYLKTADLPDAAEISAYIRDWFSQPEAIEWQKEWEAYMRSNIRDA
jgi:hypothetical protein